MVWNPSYNTYGRQLIVWVYESWDLPPREIQGTLSLSELLNKRKRERWEKEERKKTERREKDDRNEWERNGIEERNEKGKR